MATTNATAVLPPEIEREALDLLESLTAVSSASESEPDLRRMAARLAGEFERRGFAVAIREELDDRSISLPVLDVSHRAAEAAAAPPVLLIGHFDTVLQATTPRREADRLIATGAIDMKGGIVAFLKALDLTKWRGDRLPAFRLLLVPDEEVGGAISRRAVLTHGGRANALWVLEPGERRGEAETLVTGRRGMFHWRLRARGRAAHSGLAFWQGRSALLAAAAWAERAAGLSRPGGGPTVNVARLLAGEESQVAALVGDRPPLASPSPAPPVFGSAHQLNVVPDLAVVEGEARFLSSADEPILRADLERLAREISERLQVDLEFSSQESIPPVDPRTLPPTLADRAVALAREAGWRLEVEADRGGISFPNFLPDPGRIPVLDGLGPVGDGMHTRGEYVEIRSLGRRIRLLADLLREAAREAAP